MRVAIIGAGVVLALGLTGCGGTGHKAATASTTQPAAAAATQPPRTYAAPAPTLALTPDVEMTVCHKFTKILRGLLRPLQYASTSGTNQPNDLTWAQKIILRDDLKLSRWASLVNSQANDVTFANYLGDAGAAVGVVANPGADYALAGTAARDLGKVNGYCKYDAS